MHRSRPVVRSRAICQICESLSSQRRRVATPLIAARNPSQPPSQSRRATSPFIPSQARALSSAAIPGSKHRTQPVQAGKGELGGNTLAETDRGAPPTATAPTPDPVFVAEVVSHLNASISKITTTPGIPSEDNVSDALGVCEWLATRLTDDSVRPQTAHSIGESDSTASTLLSLDGSERVKTPAETTTQSSKLPQEIKDSAKWEILDNKVSETAYLALAHPHVVITPNLLEQYVRVQAKLGKPETLPKVFQLLASKPLPREGSVPVSYTEKNPNRAENAIESKIVELALDTAIAAKNLDAAVGIVENSYGTTAFVRSKLLRHGMLPLGAFVTTPIAAYILATNFSGLQQTMDSATATGVAFTGIIAYVGFTASLGIVAVMTANDQMKRVTWAPGTPLRKRWIREEERAALDKIACAWGFQESWRQGEEEGADWDALREYIGQKGMTLDRTELMEGMD
ncbi:hypothetical protein ANO14919_059280 [Xylariales sp. No.14919]|nr:hypothetical protein ANO14919_059280 [Xylariales sp. No.14919]